MLIIPAIDIKEGCVVRFVQGRLNKKIYSRDPLKTAKHWVSQGAKLIHIVDLDGAFSGKPKNLEVVKQIARKIEVPLEFGGGVRTIETIEALLKCGIWRVVLGTKAVQDKKFLIKAFDRFKDRIIVSIDAKEGRIQIKGWQNAYGATDALRFTRTLENIGFEQVIYTDILKDGTLKGPNIKEVKRLLKETTMEIIASGGISSLNDVYNLKLLEKKGVKGVIIGKALYEEKFSLAEAMQVI